MKVIEIKNKPHLLDDVIKIGDANKKHLGFYPREAFKKSASEGKIICAIDDRENLFGYLLYYVAKDRAVIQHLCVQKDSRNKGVGRLLVKNLQERTKHLEGILLNCRRDFPAHIFWAKMFIAVGEKLGRGKKAQILTTFWHDHEHPDLFMYSEKEEKELRAIAVIDHNIFIDLNKSEEIENESTILRADWLNENVKFFITDETFNEIVRCKDTKKRKESRLLAHKFDRLRHDKNLSDKIFTEFSQVMGTAKKASDWSDLKHLAYAISGNANFFITRDTDILNKAEKISKLYGIEILRPLEFVLHFDELIRSTEYRPVRLKGSSVNIRKIASEDIVPLSKKFINHKKEERGRDFEKRLRDVLISHKCKGYLFEINKSVLGFVVLVIRGEVCDIPFLRIMQGELCSTLARNVSLDIVRQTIELTNGNGISRILDQYLNVEVIEALKGVGFIESGKQFAKVNLKGVHTTEKICEIIKLLAIRVKTESDFLKKIIDYIEHSGKENLDGATTFKIEKKIWPGIISNGTLDSYIIPIQPKWAMHLFDENLAASDLFGACPKLVLNCENVYYRAAKPKVLKAPGRILWYVSGNKNFQGTKSIRAYSTIADVSIGSAKVLYKRFRRLGIYSWKDVLEKAHDKPEGDIMAVRFINTDLFKNPISRKTVDTILREYTGAIPPLSTAVKISSECYCELFNMGLNQ